MATLPLGADSALANTFTLAPGMAPAAPLMRMLSRFDRQKVEAFAEISIAMLDLLDPEPDLEDDDPSGQCDEDEFNTDLTRGGGIGCPIADPGGCEHDGREIEDGY